MKKIKFLIIFIVSVLTIRVSAATCPSDEFSRIRKIAEKVEINYEYEIKEKKDKSGNNYSYADYKIVVTNLDQDIKVIIDEDFLNGKYREFKNDGTGKGTLTGFMDGEGVTITIKAYTPNSCSGKTVLTKRITMPYYNYYIMDSRCAFAPEFKYCTDVLQRKVSSSEFDREFEKYFNENYNNEIEDNPVSENSSVDWLPIIIVISIVLVIVIAVVIFLIRRSRKNSL